MSHSVMSAPREAMVPLPETPLFGTDGIRGNVDDVLTVPFVRQLGFQTGLVLGNDGRTAGPVILGQDSRCSSPCLAAALTAGLTAAGLDVWGVGLCPTPAVAFLVQATAAIGGVMISASHNPPEDNGLKFFGADGSKLSCDQQADIESRLRQPERGPELPASSARHYDRPALLTDYLAALIRPLRASQMAPLTGLKIVLDLAWGAAVFLAPEAFHALGATVLCLHEKPSGDRINVRCGSTHLAPLRKAVLAANADLGFAFDGDADRVLAVDNQGNPIDGDHILYLWGQQLRDRGHLPGDLMVATVMSNLGFEHAWQRQGGRLIRTPVGDQHVHRVMHRSGAMIGGEQSGHIVCRHYSVTGDGIATALHLAMLVKQARVPLSALVAQSFQAYAQRLQNVSVPDFQRRRQWRQCDPLRQALSQAEAAIGHQGRILIRPSGTEPVLRIMVEAATPAIAHAWAARLAAIAHQHLAG